MRATTADIILLLPLIICIMLRSVTDLAVFTVTPDTNDAVKKLCIISIVKCFIGVALYMIYIAKGSNWHDSTGTLIMFMICMMSLDSLSMASMVYMFAQWNDYAGAALIPLKVSVIIDGCLSCVAYVVCMLIRENCRTNYMPIYAPAIDHPDDARPQIYVQAA